MLRQTNAGTTTGGFRSLCVVEIPVDEESVTITETGGNREGVQQIKNVNASAVNEGESFFTTTGVDFEYDGTMIKALKSTEKGTVVCIKGVEFKKGSSAFAVMAKGKGRIEMRLDSPEAECIAAVEIDSKDYKGIYDKSAAKPEGVHDVYLVFSDKDITLDNWQFI